MRFLRDHNQRTGAGVGFCGVDVYSLWDSLRVVIDHGADAKAIVWQHDTHVGDARATDMAPAGMVDVGQLVGGRHGENGTVLVGFAGHRSNVIAAPSLGAPDLGRRYDAWQYFEDTEALHPLHHERARVRHERETEPWGT